MSARRALRKPKPVAAAGPVHPFDLTFGTDTGGLIPGAALRTGSASDEHITAYYGIAPSILDGMLDLWLGTEPPYAIDRYTFLDVGAGKGRALLTAAMHPFREVTGIELNPALAAVARNNVAAVARGGSSSALAPVSVVEGDALEVPLPSTPTVAFLFHPFEAPVLRRFLARARAHFARRNGGHPRLDLLYVNAEHAAVLACMPAFTRLFYGLVPMSQEDHRADLAEIAGQQEYGSTGDEICGIYRLTE